MDKKKIIISALVLASVLGCIIYSNFGKKYLKLNYDNTSHYNIEREYKVKEVDNLSINYNDFDIDIEKQYNNESIDILCEFIKKNLDYDIDINKWKVYFHYDTEETLEGHITLTYYINNEIQTDKVIMFNISNGIIDSVSYSYLDKDINEDKIINKVNNFKKRVVQEKIEGEYKEETYYIYYYKINKISYNYSVYKDDVVIKDYYTVYMF